MNWVLNDSEELCFILLSVQKVSWLCEKMLLFLLEMHSYMFRSVVACYLGLL